MEHMAMSVVPMIFFYNAFSCWLYWFSHFNLLSSSWMVVKKSYKRSNKFRLQWCMLNIKKKRHRFHCLYCVTMDSFYCVTMDSFYCLLCSIGQKQAKSSLKSKVFRRNFFARTQLWCSQTLSFCLFHSIISMLITMLKTVSYSNYVSHMEIPLNA